MSGTLLVLVLPVHMLDDRGTLKVCLTFIRRRAIYGADLEVLSCTPIKQTFSVHLCHVNMRTETAKTGNVPDIVILQTDVCPSSLQATYCH